MKTCVIIVLLQLHSVKGVELSSSPSCLDGNSASVTLTCIVTNTLSSTVQWSKDNSLMTTCSFTANSTCIDTPGFLEARYSFTSDVGQKEFYLQIASAESTDIASFKCEHGTGDSKEYELANCPGTTTAPPTTTATITSTTTTTVETSTTATFSSVETTATASASVGKTTNEITHTTAKIITVLSSLSATASLVSPIATPVHSSTTMVTVTSSADSDKGVIVMAIVVSIVGFVLVIAIIFMVLLIVHWESCFGYRKHSHLGSHRREKYWTHHRRVILKQTRKRSDPDSFQSDHVLKGYQFYRGAVRNPVFEESHENLGPPFVYYRKGPTDVFPEDPPSEYLCK